MTCGEVRNYEYSKHVSITGAAVASVKSCSAARMSRRAADWKIRCHSECALQSIIEFGINDALLLLTVGRARVFAQIVWLKSVGKCSAIYTLYD